jgi:molybdopterin-binding protein
MPPLAARNHLEGGITKVLLGTVTALVKMKVGNNVMNQSS